MLSVGIERYVPICSSDTVIGLILRLYKHSNTIHHGQVSVYRFQCYWFSGYFSSSFSILKPELPKYHLIKSIHIRFSNESGTNCTDAQFLYDGHLESS